MSNPTKINSGIVTTLAATDLILGTDPGGGTLKPITLDNLLAIVRSNLQIGGRNLALGTSESPVTAKTGKRFDLSSALEIGERVMFSFVIDWVGDVTPYMEIYLGTKLGDDFTNRTTVSRDAIKKGYNCFSLSAKKAHTMIGFYTTLSSGIQVSHVKLERGNVATDWTPAPEDLGWGGVNQRFTISYDLPLAIGQKGGSHEPADNSSNDPDNYLSFESLSDMCRFIGESMPVVMEESFVSRGSQHSGRHHISGNLPIESRTGSPRRIDAGILGDNVREGRSRSVSDCDVSQRGCSLRFQEQWHEVRGLAYVDVATPGKEVTL